MLQHYKSSHNPDGLLEMPAFYKEQQYGFSGGLFKKHANQHELGYIKERFFDSITIFKPAVTIMVFDWENMQPGTFQWPACEIEVVDNVKNFLENCQVSAKDTKIIIIIMLPRCEEVSVDKCKTSLKNALSTQSSQEDETKASVKNVFMIQNGMDGLKNNPKDFVKKIFE